MRISMFILLFFCFHYTTTAQIPDYVPKDSLIGWWPFNGDAKEATGSGIDGRVNNPQLTEDRFGNPESAYLFDGIQDTINIIHNGALTFDAEDNFTISIWFQTLQNNSGSQIFSHKVLTRNGIVLQIRGDSSDRIRRLEFEVEGDQNNLAIPAPTSKDTVILGSWHHAICLFNGDKNTYYLYLDGCLQDSLVFTDDQLSGELGRSNIPFSLGKRIGEFSPSYFKGRIDDLGVWKRALSGSEIKQLFKVFNNNGNGNTCCKSSGIPSYIPENGLVGWWPFNCDADDESGKGNHGTVFGATLIEDRFGNKDNAYQFDGENDFISVNDDTTLRPAQSISISAWIYMDSTLDENFARIINKSHSEEQNYATYQIIAGNRGLDSLGYSGMTIRTGPGNSGTTSNYTWTGHSGTSILNTWQHIVGVYDGTSLKYYQNGVLVADVSHSGELFYDDENLFFGKGTGPRGEIFFKGKIDDIAIWSRALSYDEVKDVNQGNLCFEYITVTDTLLINVGITAVNPVSYYNTMKVYPNPARDYLVIDVGDLTKMEGYRILVISSDGRIVEDFTINDQLYELPLTDWGAKGLYFMQLFDAKGNLIDVKKIVLQ